MRFTKNFDIPEKLIQAQENGELLVFSGAGVSCAPPTSLPSFEELAARVEKRFGVQRVRASKDASLEPIDRFLGRVEKEGKPVRDFITEIFLDPTKSHNDLHLSLIQLFKKDQPIRIITTNFDDLFASALRELGRSDTDYYFAPALPPGDDFSGIVHVHGCVGRQASKLIYTDRDFGEAYLTKGWARRFLTAAFYKYTVLFFGYSLEDPIMQYLSRALPPESERFAFVIEGKEVEWEYKGIRPIFCLETFEERLHQEQKKVLLKWAEHIQMGLLDHEIRIKRIAQAKPPLESELIDYTLSCVSQLPKLRIFVKNVDSIEWLEWLNKQKCLENLFQSQVELSDTEKALADWIGRHFVCQNPGIVYRLYHEHHTGLNSHLWYVIIWQLTWGEARPEPADLGRWVAILLNNVPRDTGLSYSLEMLLAKCRCPEDRHAAVLLFTHLTTPVIETKMSLAQFDDDAAEENKINFEITLRGDEHRLTESWNSYFKPNIAFLKIWLIPIVESHHNAAMLMFQGVHPESHKLGPHSILRSAIERHEQDKNRSSYDILIDAARDLLEYCIKEEPDEGKKITQTWFESEVPLLKRIAIHGLTVDEALGADDKLKFILENDLLYRREFKHEVFRVVEQAFGRAGEELQRDFIRRANQGPKYTPKNDEESETLQYQVFNLLYWISLHWPDSAIVNESLTDIQNSYPHFQGRDHPEFDYWIGGVRLDKEEIPYNKQYFLQTPPKESNKILVNWEGTKKYGVSHREMMLGGFSAAVAERAQLGVEHADILISKKEWKNDVWEHLIMGWVNTTLTDEQWGTIFNTLSSIPAPYCQFRSIADLLEKGVDKAEGCLSLTSLPVAEAFSDGYWNSIERFPGESTGDVDWLTEAINHPAGKLSEFWLRALSRRRHDFKEEWKRLPDDYKSRFDKIVESDCFSAQLARVILGSRLLFLYFLDAQWTEESILPLFDFDLSERNAEQAWHGFLRWGQIHPAIEEDFHSRFVQAAERIKNGGEGIRDILIRRIVEAAMFQTSSARAGSWFYKVYEIVNAEERSSIIIHLNHNLRDMPGKAKELIWNRFLKPLWRDRIDNIPVLLETQEADELIGLTPRLETFFPEVVDLVSRMDNFNLYQTFLYADLSEAKCIDTYPEVALSLLVHLLKNTKGDFLHCNYVKTIYDRLERHLSLEQLKPLKEEILRLC